jgi:hypothetical protein
MAPLARWHVENVKQPVRSEQTADRGVIASQNGIRLGPQG